MLRVDGDWAFIPLQIRDTGVVWDTKNHKERHAAVLPALKSAVETFKSLSHATQVRLRVEEYDRIYGAAKKHLDVSIHTIRHSYAIECAKMGKTAEDIASWLGDTVAVTKKHYLGYIKPTGSPWSSK